MEEITSKELEDLKELGRKIASGIKLEQVTLTFETNGVEEIAVIKDPFLLSLLERAALEVHRRYLGEPPTEQPENQQVPT